MGEGASAAAPSLIFRGGISEGHPVGTLEVQAWGMKEYLIGAGAVLTAGPSASISGATLHAETDGELRVRAAMVDFEGGSATELSQIVILAAGWRSSQFQQEVVQPLLARGECSLVDVLDLLARATRAEEVHLFARWLPDEAMLGGLARRGVRVVAHPLETIGQAALVSGQRFCRWKAPFRAA
ncbi:MAG: hypothetical protein JO199_11870 [Candidatus Eremiobacteraeota bacterium]|nr:hypothetical protein [Candidatus Eremiobacteraeota bacterium]